MSAQQRIVICGGGNAAHVLIALLAPHHEVAVYAPLADEAARLQAGCTKTGGISTQAGAQRWTGQPWRISADPAAVFPGADLVLLALPASAHAVTLAAIAPFAHDHMRIVALPARGGFDWEARSLLGPHIPIAGLQTLPWACRIPTGGYGQRVDILGVKQEVSLAADPPHLAPGLAQELSALLCVQMTPIANFLVLTLANTGQIIHPGIMYGLFRDWDGRPFGEDEIPLFYGGVTPAIAAHLEAMSAEVQRTTAALAAHFPAHDWSGVLPLLEWCRRSYAHDIADAANLTTCFTTNRAYVGLRAPVQMVEENAVAPWFESRYLSEDVPFGLLATRGIAEIVGEPTPASDAVILWAQQALGRSWLVEGKLCGADLATTRAPQRYRLDTPHALLPGLRDTTVGCSDHVAVA